jgi:hypothetical protein
MGVPGCRPFSYGDIHSAAAAAATAISEFIDSRRELPATAAWQSLPQWHQSRAAVERAAAAAVARTQSAAALQLQLRNTALLSKSFPYSDRLVTPDAHAYAYPAAARAWQLLAKIGWLTHLPPGSVINVHPHDLCPQFLTPILPPFIFFIIT